MSYNRTAGRFVSRRGRIAGAAVCAGAALLTVGVVFQASAATGGSRSPESARPGLAQPGLGSANLVQSEDFFQQGLSPVGATVDLTGKRALSACSGEETMRTLTGGKAAAYAGENWSFDTADTLLTESAADVSTTTAAASYEKQLDALVRDCQDEPAGHWYYGTGHAFTATGGAGTWYPSYDGDGTVSGGVAVIRAGTYTGIVELTGQPTDDPSYVSGIAAAAVGRLAS
jgi:hypothetical protein